MMGRRKKVVLGGTTAGVKKFSYGELSSIALEKLIKFRDVAWSKIKKTGKEYFENSSINCYQYIVDNTMENWERWLWRLVHIVATAVAFWLIWVAGNTAILAPVATSRLPTDVPLVSVAHPAFGICPYNKLSRNRTTRFAEELIIKKSLTYSVDELVDLMSYLGLAYDFALPEGDQLDILHYILEPYNLETLLKDLAPSCDDIIKRCLWRNELVECSKIFKFRKTFRGFCCLFNYNRKNDKFLSNVTLNSATAENALPGLERGLSLLLDPQLDDYLYTTLPNMGFSALVFNPEDYPDVPSGGCYEIPVAPKNEIYISLDAISVTGSDSVKALKVNTRGCLFNEDRIKFLDSFSDCMVNCRLRNIRTTCECVPFFMPFQFMEDVCDLTASLCLKRWKDNWSQAWSGESILLDNGEYAGNPLPPPCFYCYPPCEEDIYRPHQYIIRMQPNSINSQRDSEKAIIKRDVVFVNHSVVHFFFSKDSVVHLEHGLLSNWYDLLSSLGGLCGLVLGGSIISVVEIIYYFIGGPATKFRRPQQEMRQLYWEELSNYRRK